MPPLGAAVYEHDTFGWMTGMPSMATVGSVPVRTGTVVLPVTPPTVAYTVAVPAVWPISCPVDETTRMEMLDDDHALALWLT